MPFDESLAARIRTALARKRGIEEKKMFGGVGFHPNGNLLVGVWKDSHRAARPRRERRRHAGTER
jgi:hypothetical protein